MYPYPNANEHSITRPKALFLALLCAIWLLTGLVGHDPWKPEDAHSFGIVYHILQSGDWLVPTLAGQPYMDKPPLYYMSAAITAKLLSPLLPLHDGARLVSGLYTALTLLLTGLTARELFGRGRGWAAAIILIGCLGMLVHTHQMITDLGLLTGCALMLYGFSLSHRRPQRAGTFLGFGLGVGFMAKGFIAPMLFLLIGISMLIYRNWRTRPYYQSLGIAILVAAPWLLLWPTLLYLRSPQLFTEWAWTLNIGRWFNYAIGGNYGEVYYYVNILPWFAWPALPLAAWSVWRDRRKLFHTIEYQLPFNCFMVMLVALSLVPEIKDIYALPMLLPLSVLAAGSLATLRRDAANALDWFGIMTFGLIAILMWWGWAGLLLDNHAKITELLKEYQPGFQPTVHTPTFWIALTATFLWIVLVWRVGRSMRRAVVNWSAGVTLIWVLAMTLWLPWLDSGKSYRSVFDSMQHSLPKKYHCISSENVGATQLAMLQYFDGIETRKNKMHGCELLLTQNSYTSSMEDKHKWKVIWEGGRPSDKEERFRLYERAGSGK